ncbi:MAG: hypothetical protein BWX88_03181 [Planctomycetes bacterium ADurb.Bin126]|nr:MAG: hypothetical protein BWX88_03181 [Planctomycetes bacterium ADurb.Bin126]
MSHSMNWNVYAKNKIKAMVRMRRKGAARAVAHHG